MVRPDPAMLLSYLLPIMLLLTSNLSFAAVSAQLSAQDIDELESVRLTIRATETRQTETLDLSHLERDFHVMGTNTSSQYRFVNGREQSWVDYQITLQPKSTGLLNIPPIKVGQDETPPLELRVRALSSQTRDKIKELVFFETEVSKSEVYVQAQVIYTRRLLYSNGVQLYSDLPGAPEIPNAVVLTLGETTAGSVTRNTRVYGVVEQKYAIFPEASGRLILPAISVTASVRLVENGRHSRKGVRIGTGESVIYVLPVPAGFPSDQPWLPAEDVVLHQEIDQTGSINVGDTVNHELLVHIKGNVGSIAPPIDWSVPTDHLRTYPQNPIINDDTNSTRVSGSRLQTTSVVPLKPGPLVIPEQSIYWWNTDTNALVITRSQPLALEIGGEAIAETSLPEDAAALDTTSDEEQVGTITWRALLPYAAWVLGFFVSVVFIYYLVRLIGRKLGSSRPERPSIDRTAISSATTAGDLLNALAHAVQHKHGLNRAEAMAVFGGTSADHLHFLEDLRQRAYSNDTFSLTREDNKRALALLKSAVKEQDTKAPVAPLPPLYSWQPSR